MFLLRKEYKDVIGTVDRKGLFTGVKSKYFDDWNGTGEIGWMYVRDDLRDDGTITVFDFVRSKLTNGKKCIISRETERDNVFVFSIQNTNHLLNPIKFWSSFTDSNTLVFLENIIDSNTLYVTDKEYTIIEPVHMSSVHRQTVRDNGSWRSDADTNILCARIDRCGHGDRVGNFIMVLGTWIFLFDLKEDEMTEVESLIDSIDRQDSVKLVANGPREDVALFSNYTQDKKDIKILNMKDAFRCI